MAILKKSCQTNPAFCDEFLEALGVQYLDIMDASSYEGATIIHDLNKPLPEAHLEKWSCVIDGGTLEHVFNFPEAIKSCMRCVRKNGHLILCTPWNNYAGHGFYQFSPELFYRILSPENGFLLERMLISQNGKWASVPDPDLLRMRIEFWGDNPTDLFICAKRIEVTPLFSKWPQQSDYLRSWSKDSAPSQLQISKLNTIKRYLIDRVEAIEFLQMSWRNFRTLWLQKKRKPLWLRNIPQENGMPK